MGNYPILWINVMGSLASELARKAFIAAAEMPSADKWQHTAETYAREVDQLVCALRPHLEFGFRQHGGASDEVIDDLMAYILKRHFILFFGDRRRCWVDRAVAA